MKNKEADKLSAQVTQLTGDLETSKSRADALQKDLDTTKRDLTDSKGQTDEITTQKKVIADCIIALNDLFTALDASNGQANANTRAKEADFNKKCDEAQKFL